MFWSVSDPKVAKIISRIESDIPRTEVASVQRWALPTYKVELSLDISTPQELNVIEEFILKIAMANIQGIEEEEDYAEMLGLDHVFIHNYVNELANNSAIDIYKLPTVQITETGKIAYKKRQIGSARKKKKILFYYEPLFKVLYPVDMIEKQISQEQLGQYEQEGPIQYYAHIDNIENNIINLDELHGKDVKISSDRIRYFIGNASNLATTEYLAKKLLDSFTNNGIEKEDYSEYKDLLTEKREEIQKRDAGNMSANINKELIEELDSQSTSRCIRKELGEQIDVMSQPSIIDVDCVPALFYEIWVYDKKSDEYHCRLWDQQLEQFSANGEDLLNRARTTKKEEVKKSTPVLTEQYITIVNEERASQSQSGLRILRNEDIRSEFMKTIQDAVKRIIILSPWINGAAVNRDLRDLFQKAADRGCTILIGWGIAKTAQEEEKKPPDWLLDKLCDIHSKETYMPAISVIRVGNFHTKEVLVDEKSHLVGSFNWLSYRGEFEVRGETVVWHNDKKHIKDALINIGKLFYEKLKGSTNLTILNREYVRNVNLLISICDFIDEAKAELESVLSAAITDNKTQRVVDFVKVLAINGKYDDLFNKGLIYLLGRGAYIDDVKAILSSMRLTNSVRLREIINLYREELKRNEIINNRGELHIHFTGRLASIKFSFT